MNISTLKGIVHPRIKIVSLFTHPQVVPNLYEFLSSAEHKRRYFEECLSLNPCGAPFSKKTSQTVYLPSLFKISSFVFSRRQEFIQV